MSNKNYIRIERPDDSKMCELGYHVVSGHYRVCQSGTKTWVDTHIRKNRGKLIMYLEENLLFQEIIGMRDIYFVFKQSLLNACGDKFF